ncbi:MAG TPA: divergent polysaccharide deacetylase family protein, partial [Terriglobales bacterium]|nr:divergent polysaccharide deacetylase family protein [Terriglobales bacterium]
KAAKGSSGKPGTKAGKTARRTARDAGPRGLLSLAQWRQRLDRWLDHAMGRFGIGIGIGLLAGLIIVLGFNRFNHWLAQSPDEPRQAEGKLTAPAINDATSNNASGQQSATKQASAAVTPAASPAAKTMEQLITDTQSEITEPDAAPTISEPQPVIAPQSAPAPAPTATAAVPVTPNAKPAQPAPAPSPGETVAAVPSKPQPSITPTPRDGDRPAWLRNAVAFHAPVSGPMIAIVLDDVGVNKPDAELALNLPAPITLSIMTYADNAAELAQRAHERGHELMLHVPMQPVNDRINPGPNALMVGLSSDELKRRLDWGLSRFPGFIGINNHMGSRFTQDEAGMRVVMTDLQARGLLFLDSRTIANSVGERVAAEQGVPHIGRDVFLDDEVALLGGDSVARQLAVAERIATKRGFVVAIGHPHPATVAVLQKWMADLKQRGFTLVPLSAVARRELGVAG